MEIVNGWLVDKSVECVNIGKSVECVNIGKSVECVNIGRSVNSDWVTLGHWVTCFG